MDEIQTQDYISQAVVLSAEAIYRYYVKVLEAANEIDITDVEVVANIHRLSSIAKSLVYAHATLNDYAKVESVKSAIKTLNGIQKYFQETNGNLAQEVKQECMDTLIDYLQTISKDDQLELFEI